jgi:hypothetical protein
MQYRRTLTDRSLKLASLLVSAVLLFMAAPLVFASNDPLDGRYDRISNSAAGATAIHEFGFVMSEVAVPIGSISFEFCSNTPIIGDPCTVPVGLNTASVALASQTGQIGFTISGFSTANRIVLTRPASLPTMTPASYALSGVINPTTAGSYYVRIQTYTSTDATGADIEEGGVVFALVSALSVTAEVPPYLKFCTSVTITAFDCSTATSYFIDLGELSKTQATKASSELVVATNAAYGFSVTLAGTTLTSGNNTVPALVAPTASDPGTGQFGINLRNNSSPSIGADPTGPGAASVAASYNTPNLFRFQQSDTVIQSAGTSDNKKFTVSYLTNVSDTQAAGYYATTITFICLANF